MKKFVALIAAFAFIAIGGTAVQAENNAQWQADWDHVQQRKDSILGGDWRMNLCQCECIAGAVHMLNENRWHANLGDANIAAHHHRKAKMGDFQRCLIAIGQEECPEGDSRRNMCG